MRYGIATEASIAGNGRATVEVSQAIADLRPAMLRWALALGSRPDEADDLVQETLLAAHRSRHRFDPERGALEGWVATILVRLRRNQRRSLLRRLRFLEAFRRDPLEAPHGSAAATEARLTVNRLLASLSERKREVVALYEIGELSADETARVLGLTAAGVRSIARDARLRLAEAADVSRRREGSR